MSRSVLLRRALMRRSSSSMDGSFDRLGNGDADEDDEDAVGPDDEEPSWQSGSSAYRASVNSKENE